MLTKSLSNGTFHKLPDDMRRAILADKKITAIWHGITPLARNEWICWTVSCARPETRAKHIVVMRDKMLKGERRPCCWVGCIHRQDKPLSATARWVLSRQSKNR